MQQVQELLHIWRGRFPQSQLHSIFTRCDQINAHWSTN